MRGRRGVRQLRLEPRPLRVAEHVARVPLRVAEHDREPARERQPVRLEGDPRLGVVGAREEQGRVVGEGADVQEEDLDLPVPLPKHVRGVEPLPLPPGVVLGHVAQEVQVRRLPLRGVVLFVGFGVGGVMFCQSVRGWGKYDRPTNQPSPAKPAHPVQQNAPRGGRRWCSCRGRRRRPPQRRRRPAAACSRGRRAAACRPCGGLPRCPPPAPSRTPRRPARGTPAARTPRWAPTASCSATACCTSRRPAASASCPRSARPRPRPRPRPSCPRPPPSPPTPPQPAPALAAAARWRRPDATGAPKPTVLRPSVCALWVGVGGFGW